MWQQLSDCCNVVQLVLGTQLHTRWSWLDWKQLLLMLQDTCYNDMATIRLNHRVKHVKCCASFYTMILQWHIPIYICPQLKLFNVLDKCLIKDVHAVNFRNHWFKERSLKIITFSEQQQRMLIDSPQLHEGRAVASIL